MGAWENRLDFSEHKAYSSAVKSRVILDPF